MPALRYPGALLLTFVILCSAVPTARSAHRTAVQPSAAPPQEAPDMSIAAVVNDEVISVYDLQSRERMVLMSSNIPDTADSRKKLDTEVLRSLVDERLQLQEAKKQNVVATDDEINSALGKIEKQNNMQPGQLNEFLKSHGIDRNSLINQVKASVVWAKLVRRKAAETVEISDDEVDAAMKRIKEHAGEPQSRIAEIFLAVDNPSQDAEVRALAEKLTEQMRQGARFSAIAQQFSQSATAAVGGDLGWLRPDQLPPDLASAVAGLKPGELSPPIRSGGGYYLMLVLDRRNGDVGGGTQQAGTVYDVVQVVVPLPPNPNEAMKRSAAAEVMGMRQSAKNCAELLKIGKQKAPQLASEGNVSGNNVAPQMKQILDKLSPNQASEPILQRNGIGVIMLCSKRTQEAKKGDNAPTRDEVFDSLLHEKLDTVSRQYLRDLRRAAYVDVRV